MKPLVLLFLAAAIACAYACGGEAEPTPADPAGPSCGNGALDSGEACDGTQLGGATCEALGFGAGSLRCSAACTLDSTGCGAPASCGNGTLDGSETCDGAELGGATCAGLGLESGTLACNDRCTGFDTRACEAGSCAPLTCEAAGAACGALADGCGGTLECEDVCSSDEPWFTCGGGGTANACGATCPLTCPAESACNADGVCSFVPTPQLDVTTRQISLRFLLDGATPVETGDCANPLSTVGSFVVQSQLSASASVSGSVLCGTQWRVGPVALAPGAYTVRLTAREGASNVPPLTVRVPDVPVGNVDGELVVDVRTARLQGSLTLNGAAPVETSCSEGERVGTLEFRNPSLQTVEVSVPCGGGFTFDARVFPGDYQVTLRGTNRSNLPNVRVLRSVLRVDQSVSGLVLEAATTTATVSGSFTFNGAPPTTAAGCTNFSEAGRVTFSRDGADSVFANIPCAGPFTYAVQLEPGTYRVSARSLTNSGIEEPSFQRDFPDLVVVGGAPQVYDVVVPLVDVTGRITLAGQPPTADATCSGNAATISVGLRSIPVPCGGAFAFGPARFVPGTYAATVTASSSTNLPSSSSAALVVPPAGPATLDLTPARQLTLRVTVNGAAPADCMSGEAARITLRSEAGFTAGLPIPCGAGFEITRSLPAGAYQVSTGPALGGTFPLYVHPTPVDLQMDRSVTIDIVTRTVSGQIRRNGVMPIETEACTAGQTVAEVLFFDARSGSSTPLVSPIACGAGLAWGPLQLAVGVYAIHVRPVGTPPRSDLPPYQYLAVPRFLVE